MLITSRNINSNPFIYTALLRMDTAVTKRLYRNADIGLDFPPTSKTEVTHSKGKLPEKT